MQEYAGGPDIGLGFIKLLYNKTNMRGKTNLTVGIVYR
jgi:hypothetical protein